MFTFLIFVSLILFSGCAQQRVIIRAANPPSRSENVLEVNSYKLPTATPEQCLLAMEEHLYNGIRWFPREPDPLHIDKQAITDMAAHANFMIHMVNKHTYPWLDHRYVPLIMHKAAWAELFGLLTQKVIPNKFTIWDLQLRHLVAAKQYALMGRRYSHDPEWVRLNERARYIIDQSYEDLDWMHQYLRHWVCSNVLAPANHDSTFYCESLRILLNLRDRSSDRFEVVLLSDLEEIEDQIQYFEIDCGIIDTVIPPGVVLEDDLFIPTTRMNNPDAVGLVVGITEYDSPEVPRVKYAGQGATRVREMLVKTLGYSEDNILPRTPTQKMTLGQMKTLVLNVLPEYITPGKSDVFIYIACHGVPLIDNDDVGLVPSDCDPNFATRDNSYALSDLYKDLNALNLMSLTLVLDACFSGRSGSGAPLIYDASPPWIIVRDVAGHFSNPNHVEYLACKRNQLSNWFTEKGHTFFTYIFLKGITGDADHTSGNADGILTYNELKTYLEDREHGIPWHSLRFCGRPQNPVTYGLNLDRVFIVYP